MLPVGIIGDGYTAADLLRILGNHEQVRVVKIFSTENIGKGITEVYPSLERLADLTCERTDLGALKRECRAVFWLCPTGCQFPMLRN